MNFYGKFYVIKKEDVSNYLEENEKEQFETLIDVLMYRKKQDTGKGEQNYYAINEDEPYIELIKRVIEIGENKKEWDEVYENFKRDINLRWD